MPKVNLRATFPNLDIANAGQPAGLSGAATITGTMRDGQTPVASWPSVVNGKPVTVTATYIIRYSNNGRTDFVIAKQGGTPQTMDALTSADVGRQYQLVMRVHNAANQVDAEPQILSALSAVVTAAAISAPTFASGPILTGTAANDQVMTVAFTTSGTAPITSSIRWLINEGIIVGETGTTWTGLGLVAGDLVPAEVKLDGPGGTTGWVRSNSLLVTPGTATQTATFGTVTPAGSGGWRPQLASGAVEALTSYNSLTSGSLGSYVPSIASGRLVFTGGGAGAPNGAVLNCTGASGRVYTVTIATVAARKDIAANADITANRGVTANLGLTLVIRQDAQIPSKTSDISGNDWLGATSQTMMNNALLSPITVYGEGAHVDGEYHLHSWKGYIPSGITIDHVLFANQTATNVLTFLTSSSRRARAQTVKNCSIDNNFNVDQPGADWSIGFRGTGYGYVGHIYTNGNYTEDLYVYDNDFRHGYTQLEIQVLRAFWEMGNSHSSAYYDFRKIQLATPTRTGKYAVRMSGGNLVKNFEPYSVNEGPYVDAGGIPRDSTPHVDVDQVSSGSAPYVFFSEANIVYNTETLPLQYLFHGDRSNTALGGFRWSIAGNATIGQSPHSATNAWPDHVVANKFSIAPGPQYLSDLPIGAGGTSSNVPQLGARKVGDGGNAGEHYFTDMYCRTAFLIEATGPTLSQIHFANMIYYNGYSSGDLAADLYHWGSWASLPVDPSHAVAWERACRPVVSSDYEAISPYSHVTFPGSGNMSGYTISDTLRPVPVLTSLTITNAATAAFTVSHNIINDNLVAFCAIFAADCTDPDQIRKGVRWTGSAWVDSVDRWNDHSTKGETGFVGGGVSSLASGTYWLCIAAYNGPKKTGVATVQFTVT